MKIAPGSNPPARLERVEGKPQRYAAMALEGGALLGYCGRDGVITHPVDGVPIGTKVTITMIEDLRKPKQGLHRSLSVSQALLEGKADNGATRWKEVSRKEIGLYAPSPAAGSEGYFHLVYEVTESTLARVPEYRKRIEHGGACRFRGEGYAAFVSLFGTYAEHARQHDANQHETKNMRCTSTITTPSKATPSAPKIVRRNGAPKKRAAGARS